MCLLKWDETSTTELGNLTLDEKGFVYVDDSRYFICGKDPTGLSAMLRSIFEVKRDSNALD